MKETTALIRLTNDEEKETWARLGSELVTLARTIHGLSDKLSSIKRDQHSSAVGESRGASRPGPAPSENEALLAFEAAAAEVSRATFERAPASARETAQDHPRPDPDAAARLRGWRRQQAHVFRRLRHAGEGAAVSAQGSRHHQAREAAPPAYQKAPARCKTSSLDMSIHRGEEGGKSTNKHTPGFPLVPIP